MMDKYTAAIVNDNWALIDPRFSEQEIREFLRNQWGCEVELDYKNDAVILARRLELNPALDRKPQQTGD